MQLLELLWLAMIHVREDQCSCMTLPCADTAHFALQLPRLVDERELRAELQLLRTAKGLCSVAPVDAAERNALIAALHEWILLVAASFGVHFVGFTNSLGDGSLLCLLVRAFALLSDDHSIYVTLTMHIFDSSFGYLRFLSKV